MASPRSTPSRPTGRSAPSTRRCAWRPPTRWSATTPAPAISPPATPAPRRCSSRPPRPRRPTLAPAAWYNLGNARLGGADARGAIDAYREALLRRPDFAAAKHNLELALRELERQRQEQEKQQQDQKQQQEKQQQEQPQEKQDPQQGGAGQAAARATASAG